MHHDQTPQRRFVEAFAQAMQTQGIAVATLIGAIGQEQAKTGLVTALAVGKGVRNIVAGSLAVRDMLFKQQLLLFKIKHPQARQARGNGVIDDGNAAGIDADAVFTGAVHRRNRFIDDRRLDFRGQTGDQCGIDGLRMDLADGQQAEGEQGNKSHQVLQGLKDIAKVYPP